MKKLFFALCSITILSSALYADYDANEDLMSAAMLKDDVLALMAINDGANVNYKNSDGNTPLHIAMQTGVSVGVNDAATLAFKVGKVVDLLLNNGADNTVANDAGIRPIENALRLCDVAPDFFNKERFGKLMLNMGDSGTIAQIVKDLYKNGNLTPSKPIMDWLFSFSSISITAEEFMAAEIFLANGSKPEHESKVTDLPKIMQKYYVVTTLGGKLIKADLAETYLTTVGLRKGPLETKGLNASSNKSFDNEKFRESLLEHLIVYRPNEADIPLTKTSELAALALEEFVFNINLLNKHFDINSSLGKDLLSKGLLNMFYSENGLIEYYKLRIAKCEGQSKARTAFYTAIMILNEVTRSFAYEPYIGELKIGEKILETDLLVKEESKTNPDFAKIYSKAKVSEDDLIKETKTLEKMFIE